METNKNKSFKGIESAGLVIIACFIVALCIYHFVFGNPANFMNNDPNNHPLPGNLLGTIYKGGVIVPVIQTLLLTVLALSVERYFTIRASFGRGKLATFVAEIKQALTKGDLEAAQALCDKQRGSVANVVGATLRKYREMENTTDLTKDQKILAIQKELENQSIEVMRTIVKKLVPTLQAEQAADLVSKFIADNLNVPVISCGAGKYCSGQVLVSDDVFGKYSEFKPKFARKYGDMKTLIFNCAKQFDEDVKNGKFPSDDEIFSLSEEELKQLRLHEGSIKC